MLKFTEKSRIEKN